MEIRDSCIPSHEKESWENSEGDIEVPFMPEWEKVDFDSV